MLTQEKIDNDNKLVTVKEKELGIQIAFPV